MDLRKKAQERADKINRKRLDESLKWEKEYRKKEHPFVGIHPDVYYTSTINFNDISERSNSYHITPEDEIIVGSDAEIRSRKHNLLIESATSTYLLTSETRGNGRNSIILWSVLYLIFPIISFFINPIIGLIFTSIMLLALRSKIENIAKGFSLYDRFLFYTSGQQDEALLLNYYFSPPDSYSDNAFIGRAATLYINDKIKQGEEFKHFFYNVGNDCLYVTYYGKGSKLKNSRDSIIPYNVLFDVSKFQKIKHSYNILFDGEYSKIINECQSNRTPDRVKYRFDLYRKIMYMDYFYVNAQKSLP